MELSNCTVTKLPGCRQGRWGVLVIVVLLTMVPVARIWAGEEPLRRKVTAAVLDDFPPLYGLDVSGQPAGFAIDVFRSIADEASLEFDYVICENWAQALEAVRSGQADLMPGIGISSSRQEEFAYTHPIETIQLCCFVRQESYHIASIDDLTKDHQTAVIDKSVAETRLQNISDTNLVIFPNIDSALLQLLAGQVDAFVFSRPALEYKLKMTGLEDRVKIVGQPLMELKRAYLLRKDDTELLELLDSMIKHYTLSDSYFQTYQKWYGSPTPFWTVAKLFWTMSGVILVVLIAEACWKYRATAKLNRELMENISKRQHVEEEREKLVKILEFKNRELRDIVYTASHDLRSPLVNIQGFGKVLMEDCGDLAKALNSTQLDAKDSDEADVILTKSIPESLGFITGSAGKMAKLLDGLLQISRVGTVEILNVPVHMDSLMRGVLKAMEYQINDNQVAVTVGPLVDCMGDPQMLDRIFCNLINNAIKYRDPNRKPEVTISGSHNGLMSVYCVADNGIGVAEQHQKKIFEIFHRLNPTHDTEGEGLGLTIVRRGLDRMNGRVRVESEVGKGSRFFISLPTVPQSTEQQDAMIL